MPAGRAAADALLFDLGGVLIEIDFGRAFGAWARSAGVPTARIAARFAFDSAYEAHERGEIDAARYCAHLRDRLELALSTEELLAGWNAIFVGPHAGAEALLEHLARSFPLYLFSNTNEAHRAIWQSRYPRLLAPLSGIFCSCDLGARKPARDAFLEVCRRIGRDPARIAFFDDQPANVRGARDAGLNAHEASSVADLRRLLADELHVSSLP